MRSFTACPGSRKRMARTRSATLAGTVSISNFAEVIATPPPGTPQGRPAPRPRLLLDHFDVLRIDRYLAIQFPPLRQLDAPAPSAGRRSTRQQWSGRCYCGRNAAREIES